MALAKGSRLINYELDYPVFNFVTKDFDNHQLRFRASSDEKALAIARKRFLSLGYSDRSFFTGLDVYYDRYLALSVTVRRVFCTPFYDRSISSFLLKEAV